MLNQIKEIKNLDELNALYASAFGKNGSITLRLKGMKDLSQEERAVLNREKDEAVAAFKARTAELEDAAIRDALSEQKLDVSLSPEFKAAGKLHPLTQTMAEISDILSFMGYGGRVGPQIEDDFHNFIALNTPEHHPARDMQDSFFINAPGGVRGVLRSQTSSVQIRAMESEGVPIKMYSAGAVYRREIDATHAPMFHQIEGLVIDRDVTLSDLVSDIKTFLGRFFGLESVPLRIRPSYFPFTEPSIEVDMQWDKKTGTLGAGSDWLEMGGAGMVHPNVLQAVGVDANAYQGFAFGFGLDRLAMLKYGLNDIRKFFDGDVRWLSSNGF
jgi:phenylalanyl-tRNA synthetase alpha chain